MCSIAGLYWFGSNRPKSETLLKMTNNALVSLKNRGPDESSIVEINDRCVMSGNRLIIRGDRGKGSMPFSHNNDLLFYNGEIYNFQEWDRGVYSDGEILLPLYNEFGFSAFSKLDGEFAISIWDDSHETLLLIRDQFGTKPIYFSLNDERLLWASSAGAINEMQRHNLCAAVKGPTYHCTYSVQEPYTSYEGIWLLPPGHFLVAKRSGIKLFCYNHWGEYLANSEDVDQLFESLESSIRSRLDYTGTIGISMSGGIDSGIIAFMADKLNVKYHIFSVIEMFGEKTEETDAILERVERLKNAGGVSLLRCNEDQYQKALKHIYLPNYYDSEKFDTGNISTYTVFEAMKKQNIRVAIDGTGGDELFHGYNFRDQFKPPEGWPEPWKNNNFFYSLFTTLLDYTAKADRAGAFFSIETRFPYQSVRVMKEALKLKYSDSLKWPLRKLLLEYLDYGDPTDLDLKGKVGFDLKNKDKQCMLMDMLKKWCEEHSITSLPINPPKKFPFKMGIEYS